MSAQKETRHKAERKAARFLAAMERERQREVSQDGDSSALPPPPSVPTTNPARRRERPAGGCR